MSSEVEENERTETLPFAMKHLPDYFIKKAERELNETPERRITGLEEMKKMARDHKLTCDTPFVDDFLLQFLRHRKFDVSRAFKQLVNFVTFRKNYSSLFLSSDNDYFSGDPSRHFYTILPFRCPEGCTIVLVELGKWDPKDVPYQDIEQMAAIMFTQSIRDPMTQINGYKLIYDFKGTTLKHARYCTPPNLYRVYHAGLDCFPARWRGIYLVSESLMMKTVWTMFKPLLPHKLQQRIFVNYSRTDLLNHFPPSVLPVKYGGVLEDNYDTEWTKMANKQQEGFGFQGQCNYY